MTSALAYATTVAATITAIAGAIQAVLNLKPQRPPGPETTGPLAPRLERPGFLVGLLVVASILLLLFGAINFAIANRPPDDQQSATVRITRPECGDLVLQGTRIKGTSSGVKEGQKIWIVLQLLDASGAYYAQDGPVFVQHDGSWASSVTLISAKGKIAKIGRIFDILAVLATQEAQYELNRSSQEDRVLGGLPVGASVYDRITVVNGSTDAN